MQSLVPDEWVSDFEWAAVKRHFEGRESSRTDRPGWGWGELDRIDRSSGANRAERDALRLVSLLIAHSDTKPSNQRLVCVADRDGSDTCPRPFALIHDLGDTFGLNNGGLAQWKKSGIWKNRERCAVTMREFPDDSATFPERYISEEGRQLLARELRMLTDAQIEALFVSTRITRSGSGNGNADAWVQTMRDRNPRDRRRPSCPEAAAFEASPAYKTAQTDRAVLDPANDQRLQLAQRPWFVSLNGLNQGDGHLVDGREPTRARLHSFFRTISCRMWRSSVRSATPASTCCFHGGASELAQLLRAQPGELLLPPVERLLADAEPTADLGDFLAALHLV